MRWCFAFGAGAGADSGAGEGADAAGVSGVDPSAAKQTPNPPHKNTTAALAISALAFIVTSFTRSGAPVGKFFIR